MIYLLGAAWALTMAVFFVHEFIESRRRDTENDAWRKLLAEQATTHREAVDGLVQVIERERDARRAETARLLQRIQAPEQAVVEHQVSQAMQYEMPQPPQTDEEFAEYREQSELIRQMEAAENAHLQGQT